MKADVVLAEWVERRHADPGLERPPRSHSGSRIHRHDHRDRPVFRPRCRQPRLLPCLDAVQFGIRGRTGWQRTKGPSDLYVQSNVWTPGGTTGWHTHPGRSLIIVTAGTMTAYEADDPTCAPRQYTIGEGFVDEGGDHVHVLRNEQAVEARTVAVQLVPADATRRIDAATSPHCGF